MKEKFPIEDIINYKHNRYELVQACVKRAYQLIISEMNNKVNDEAVQKKGKALKESKLAGIAMNDILSKKVKFYVDKSENI